MGPSRMHLICLHGSGIENWWRGFDVGTALATNYKTAGKHTRERCKQRKAEIPKPIPK